VTTHPRRWFQLSLKSLFLLTLVVAAFFAGYTLATKQAERQLRQAEQEAQSQIEEARAQADEAAKRADKALRRFLW
jgi:cell division protein FtsL